MITAAYYEVKRTGELMIGFGSHKPAKRLRFSSLALLYIFSFFALSFGPLSGAASADTASSSATVNSSSSTTVGSSASITTTLTATTSGSGANNDWSSTAWILSTSANTPAANTFSCANTSDHTSSGTFTETFSITAPASSGTYNAYFIPYQNDGCTGGNNNAFKLANAVTVDATAPFTPTANPATGSYNSTQNVTLSSSDNIGGSGLSHIYYTTNGTTPTNASSVYSSTISVTSNTTIKAIAYDNVGNASSVASFTYTIDGVAPVIASSVAPAANGNGWNNTNVTVGFTCSDDNSGLATNTVAGTTLSTEGAGQSVTNTGSCVDNAGNTATSVTVNGINIDKTKPVISGSATTSPNGNGWYNHSVTVNFTCSDSGGSGIDTNSVAGATLSTDGAGQSVTNTGTCTDKAGNVADSTTVNGINIDTTKPVITPNVTAANANGWNNADVTVTFTCSDGTGSGIDTDTIAGATVSTEGANQSVTNTGTCTDKAGNIADSVTVNDINIDKTKPVITSNVPAPNSNGWYNSDVAVDFTCADDGLVQSGIDTGTVAGATLSVDGAGQSLTNTGDCVDLAGNAADSVTVNGINIDQTKPTIPTASLPEDTYTSPQSIELNSSDNGSGLDAIYYTTDGTTPTTGSHKYTGPITVSNTTTITAIAYDKAGNVSASMSQTYTINTPPPPSGGGQSQSGSGGNNPLTTLVRNLLANPATLTGGFGGGNTDGSGQVLGDTTADTPGEVLSTSTDRPATAQNNLISKNASNKGCSKIFGACWYYYLPTVIVLAAAIYFLIGYANNDVSSGGRPF